MAERKIVLLTGFPTNFVATRVLHKLLSGAPDVELRCVVQGSFLERARETVSELPADQRQRVELLEGDAAAMDLGLSGPEFNRLASEVQLIHHCAAITYAGVQRDVAKRTNVDAAREVLELADVSPHLERLVHWSTALVSGARRGYVLEQELTAPDGFRNVIEETRYRAEKVIRESMEEIPTTVLRPTTIVGDAGTGEIDRFEGIYLLILLMLNAPTDFRVPLPGRGDVPLNLVPIDYVVEAGCRIVSDPRSIGRTFHIVDPEPPTSRQVFELIARATGRPLPRGQLPMNLATALLRTPGLERLAHLPRSFLEQLTTEVIWDDRNTRELLADTDLECPRFESYVETMTEYVRQQQEQRRARVAEEELAEADPLD
jgi:nucleoside-diphosphate-sugar epimerase